MIIQISSFKEKDAFVGYQKDVAAAVVFQASSQLRKYCGRWREGDEYSSGHQLWETAWKSGLLGDCPLYKLVDEEEGSDQWKQAVRLLYYYGPIMCKGIYVIRSLLSHEYLP